MKNPQLSNSMQESAKHQIFHLFQHLLELPLVDLAVGVLLQEGGELPPHLLL